MKSISLNLQLAETVKKFVNICNKYDYDMDIRSGRHVVSAKSLLGVFGLDLDMPVVLEIYSDSCDDIIKELQPYIA